MKKRTRSAIKLIAAVVILTFFLLPVYWAVTTSIKPNSQIFAYPATLIPTRLSFTSWLQVLSGGAGDADTAFTNSIIYALSVTSLTLLIALPAAYAASRFEFRGKRPTSLLMYLVMVTPSTVLAVPLFFVMVQLGLYDTGFGYVVAYTALTAPFAVWLLKPFIDAIPRDLEEAARVDGASQTTILARIVGPLSRHGLSVVGLLAFVWTFNDFSISFIMLNSTSLKTLPALLVDLVDEMQLVQGGGGGVNYSYLSTLSVLGMLPPLILFLIFRRYFEEGLTKGALKG